MTKCIMTLNNILTENGGLSRLLHIKNHAPYDVGCYLLGGEITAKLNVEQGRTKSQEAETHTETHHSIDVPERVVLQVWFQQPQRQLGRCLEMQISMPLPTNQKFWGWDTAICELISPLGNPDS